MARNFHVLPRKPVKIPMPPVRPTMGVRPRIGCSYVREYWDGDVAHDNELVSIWPVAVFAAAVLAIVAIGIFIA